MEANHLPASVGVGFKHEHFDQILATGPRLGFFEVHAENYMGDGGPAHARLTRLRRDYAISIHGVGLSIGAHGPLDREHLRMLKAVCERYQPESFSEHLAWSTHDSAFLNDLLPLPYNEETLAVVADHIDEVQEVLGRRMLLENPSSYLAFADSTLSETQFLREIARRTGCGLLLDVNNVFVSAINLGTNALAYIDGFPLEHVGEIHLGGHDEEELPSGAALLIDAHGSPVADPVWALYAQVIERTGPLPTLIERDNEVPPWGELMAEAMRAQEILQAHLKEEARYARAS
jgi:uncharacterized protein